MRDMLRDKTRAEPPPWRVIAYVALGLAIVTPAGMGLWAVYSGFIPPADTLVGILMLWPLLIVFSGYARRRAGGAK